MKCPVCGAVIEYKRSDAAIPGDDPGTAMRIAYVSCPNCGPGKCAVKYDFEFFNLGPEPQSEGMKTAA